eukprot:1352812-Amphidinium_carterae.1
MKESIVRAVLGVEHVIEMANAGPWQEVRAAVSQRNNRRSWEALLEAVGLPNKKEMAGETRIMEKDKDAQGPQQGVKAKPMPKRKVVA